MAKAKARRRYLKDRFFNVGFILDPAGEGILRHYKVSPLFPVEHSVCPHDVYDWWVEKYGKTLDAFWPVADTEIGRLGIMMPTKAPIPRTRAPSRSTAPRSSIAPRIRTRRPATRSSRSRAALAR